MSLEQRKYTIIIISWNVNRRAAPAGMCTGARSAVGEHARHRSAGSLILLLTRAVPDATHGWRWTGTRSAMSWLKLLAD
jgi:hypothetical protein